MWIELSDGAKTQWVLDENCLNDQGVACSFGWELTPSQAPEWLKAPERSILREMMNWGSCLESRSMCSTIPMILEFYRECVQAGGLKITATAQVKVPSGMAPPRRGPGVNAESNEYWLSIDAFEYAGTVFWTIQHGARVSPSPRPHRPSKLLIVGVTGDRVSLLDEDSGEKYSALPSALKDSRPKPANTSFVPQQILWGSLPDWLQFRATEESIGELRGYHNTKIEEMWWANRCSRFASDPQQVFVSALEWLDERGFDRTGERTPDRSYFVSILQGGASLNLKARSEVGDSASLTVLDTLGHMSINMNYHPPNGTPPPPTIPTQESSNGRTLG